MGIGANVNQNNDIRRNEIRRNPFHIPLTALAVVTSLLGGCGACDPLSDTTRLRVTVVAGILEMDQFAVSVLDGGELIVGPDRVPETPAPISEQTPTVVVVLDDDQAGKDLRVRVDAYLGGTLVGSGALARARAVANEMVDVQVALGEPAVVGDGIIARGLEDCDDGNTEGGDGCSAFGTFEAGWLCNAAEPTVCTNNCGDGLVVGPEACDDANAENGDGCSGCTLEPGYTCTGEPSECEAGCNDGIISGGEECDDGNLEPDDGCSPNCAIGEGYTCTGAPSVCVRCGDGLVTPGEVCDDGNSESGDGCAETCTVEAGYTCNDASPTVCSTDCGDGIRTEAEDCDDGNDIDGDGCEACVVSTGFVCVEDGGGTSQCGTVCGDGNIAIGIEGCEDGGTIAGDGCSATCAVEFGWTCPVGAPCTAVCGDGFRTTTEACDDGNPFSGDGCSSTCENEGAALCGNGVVDRGEQCDSGEDAATESGCSQCLIVAGYVCNGEPSVCTDCGNGVVEDGEVCDALVPGMEEYCELDTCELAAGIVCKLGDDGSSYDCVEGLCGNSNIEAEFSEECDDGNAESGDGCSQNCRQESGYVCNGAGDCMTECSDGLVAGAETCDGGPAGVPGCDPMTCQVEEGYFCSGQPSVCTTGCGNGALSSDEQCDDGNIEDGDGCSEACTLEAGYSCPVAGQTCIGICGDGMLTAQETCDDGNADPGDGCSTYCGIEAGFSCSTALPSMCVANCADGKVRGAETCDDGGLVANDGCSLTCAIEDGWTCVGEPSTCDADCGDGVINGNEECDDGASTPGDGCSAFCVIEPGYSCIGEPSNCARCGDGVVAPTLEACDDGNAQSGDGCSSGCLVESGYTCTDDTPNICSLCGDGLLTGSELCDDGGIGAGDGCDSECKVEVDWTCENLDGPAAPTTCARCGDGTYVPELEGCDDGSDVEGDGCENCMVTQGFVCTGSPSMCTLEGDTCGNGVVEAAVGEECDDGETSLPGCTNCAVDEGFSCSGSPSICTGCGDGVIQPEEGCDDGNQEADDGCDKQCNIEEGYRCLDAAEPSVCGRCGDGVVSADFEEECDDGDNGNGDNMACTAECKNAFCGDSLVYAEAEQCDDANGNANDDCVGCQWAYCGDNNRHNAYEECDRGPNANNDLAPSEGGAPGPQGNGCKSTCVFSTCGDGIVQTNEECDNGGSILGFDGCNTFCNETLGNVCRGEPSLCTSTLFDGDNYIDAGECRDAEPAFDDETGQQVNTCLTYYANELINEGGTLFLPQGDYYGLVHVRQAINIVGERSTSRNRQPLSRIVAQAYFGLIIGDDDENPGTYVIQNVAISGALETGDQIAGDPLTPGGIFVAKGNALTMLRSVVENNDGIGIIASESEEIRIESSLIRNNTNGGLLIGEDPTSGRHVIVNNIITGNGTSEITPRVSIGGVLIPKKTDFLFNTVADNTAAPGPNGEVTDVPSGVFCTGSAGGDAPTLTGLIVWGNGGSMSQLGGACGEITYSALDTNADVGVLNTTSDPLLDVDDNYRIRPGSSCIDFVSDADTGVSRDFDLHQRPHPSTGVADCGADEVPYYPLSGMTNTVPTMPRN